MMKKILFFLAVTAFTALSVSAQISKGSSYLGGNLFFSTNTVTNDASNANAKSKQTGFGVTPSIGFAYKENRVWGLYLNYNYNKQQGNAYEKTSTYGVGAFLRQYKPLGKNFYLFAQEALLANYSTGQRDYSTYSDVKAFNANVSLSPGFAYDVSKKFQLELLLNSMVYASYTHSKVDPKSSIPESGVSKTTSFNIGSNLNQLAQVGTITVGARFAFGR